MFNEFIDFSQYMMYGVRELGRKNSTSSGFVEVDQSENLENYWIKSYIVEYKVKYGGIFRAIGACI